MSFENSSACPRRPFFLKKDCQISKSCFIYKDQIVILNFELSYNEQTLALF